MTEPTPVHRAQILDASAALRAWSEDVRAWSRSTRRVAAAVRLARHDRADLGWPDAGESRAVVGTGAPLPVVGPLAVADLLDILVHDHGIDPRQAWRSLALAMLGAGYPPDSDRVAAADAFDVVHHALAGSR